MKILKVAVVVSLALSAGYIAGFWKGVRTEREICMIEVESTIRQTIMSGNSFRFEGDRVYEIEIVRQKHGYTYFKALEELHLDSVDFNNTMYKNRRVVRQ